jgi:hypothetical protein
MKHTLRWVGWKFGQFLLWRLTKCVYSEATYRIGLENFTLTCSLLSSKPDSSECLPTYKYDSEMTSQPGLLHPRPRPEQDSYRIEPSVSVADPPSHMLCLRNAHFGTDVCTSVGIQAGRSLCFGRSPFVRRNLSPSIDRLRIFSSPVLV